MKLELVAVAVIANAGKGCVINPCPIPVSRFGIQDIANYRPNHTGVGYDQHMFIGIIRQNILQRLRNPLPEIFQCFRTLRAVTAGVTIKCRVFPGTTPDDFIRAEALPAAKADFPKSIVYPEFKPAFISQRFSKSTAASHGGTDDALPGQPLANGIPHLPPAIFAQGIVDTIASKTPAADRLTMAQKINQRIVHDSFSVYPAGL